MSEIKILKVKLIKNGEKVDIVYRETGEMKSTVDKTCDQRPHVDFTNAVNALSCHLGILTDYLTERKALEKEELEKFVVTGYSIGGAEDEEGVTITGYRKTKSGKTVTLNTPFLKLESSDESYYLIGNLNECLQNIEREVLEYLDGKKAPEEQLELDLPEENVTMNKMQIVPPDQNPFAADEGAKLIIDASNARTEVRKNGRKKKEEAIHFPEE